MKKEKTNENGYLEGMREHRVKTMVGVRYLRISLLDI